MADVKHSHRKRNDSSPFYSRLNPLKRAAEVKLGPAAVECIFYEMNIELQSKV